MGFKNKLNKMKSFLFDEEEIEEKKAPVIIKEKKVEKKIFDEVKEDDYLNKKSMEDFYFEDVSDNNKDTSDIGLRVQKKSSEFQFPEFDDDDFMVAPKKPEPIIEEVKPEPKVLLYQGSKRKEETKKFKPSPIISPIYGLLDKEGNSLEKENKKESVFVSNKEASFDDIRKKAYGILDEELENTMKRLSKKTIEEAEKDMEKEEIELSRTKDKFKKIKESKAIALDENDEEKEDDMILPNINFKEIDIDKEREKLKETSVKEERNIDDDEDDDTKEQDLFNLIDTMYSKEGDEE